MAMLKSRWREIAGFLAAAIIIAGGTYLAFTVKEVWLNRAGALVIIAGVILAASRVNEVLSAKVAAFVEGNFDPVFSETLVSLERELNEKLSNDRQRELREQIHKEMFGEIGSLLEERKRMFKLYEVALVVIGTFLNGLGDWLVCLIK
jgi:hypothetical protein